MGMEFVATCYMAVPITAVNRSWTHRIGSARDSDLLGGQAREIRMPIRFGRMIENRGAWAFW